MENFAPSYAIAEEIRLSIAPVFLLTAISALLSVLTARLARAVDRLRQITSETADGPPDPSQSAVLRKRISRIRQSIRACVAAAIVVCIVVMCIFAGDYILPDLSTLIAVLFVSAMLLLMTGFGLLFAELSLAAHHNVEQATD